MIKNQKKNDIQETSKKIENLLRKSKAFANINQDEISSLINNFINHKKQD